MATGSSSLRFTVEVASDQADKALKAMAVAFNEAGAQARIAMQSISAPAKAAGAEVVTLGDKIKSVARDQRSEARAAQFYVQSIAEIVPVSNSAKIAIGGIGEALIGGMGIGAAIAIVVTGIKLMTAAWEEEEKAAKKAADERAKRIDEIQRRIDANRTKGQTPAEAGREGIRLVEMQIGERQSAIEGLNAANAADEALLMASQRYDPNIGNRIDARKAEIARLRDEIARARIEIDKLREFVQSDIEAAANTTQGPKKPEGLEGVYDSYVGVPSPGMPWSQTRKPIKSTVDLPDQVTGLTETLRDYNREQQRSIALSEQWGSTLGNVFAQLATGQMTAGQALAAIGQMMIQQITSIAISSITASASKAGAEAAASQAGIPIVGPAMGIAAMGAMMSAVLALLGNVGKRAAGGQVLAGMPYVVGELGPELFVPGVSGGVVPSHRMPAGGGGITLNVQGLIDSGTLGRTITANDGEFARANRKLRRRRRM